MTYRRGQRVRPKLYIKAIPIVLSLIIGLVIGVAVSNLVRSRHIAFVSLQTEGSENNQVSKVAVTAKHLKKGPSFTPSASQAEKTQAQQSLAVSSSCGMLPPKQANLATAVSPELRKLAQYEQLCGGALADRSAFFVPTPTTVTEAQQYAGEVAITLKEYAKFDITPLVYMEPDTADGVNLDLGKYQAGAYNAALDAYFATLKSNGITNSMMGTWVLIPEGNIPGWGSVNPVTFAADVTITAHSQKKYFPESKSTILLDSESYPSASSWSNGTYSSLVPYVQSIPKGLINSFGLEGFPWAPPANQQGPLQYDPKVYLRIDLAAQAARALDVKSIWLNTGTFHQMYAGNAAETVTMTPGQRQTILSGVIAQAVALKQQGFTVAVHLFAQNKANTSEGTDWSYWQTNPGDTADTDVLMTFVRDLHAANVSLWLFDTYDQ